MHYSKKTTDIDVTDCLLIVGHIVASQQMVIGIADGGSKGTAEEIDRKLTVDGPVKRKKMENILRSQTLDSYEKVAIQS